MGSFCLSLGFGLGMGCDAPNDAPLVVATTWSVVDREPIEAIFLEKYGRRLPIEWVRLGNRESLAKAVDRRGGVDLILGAPAWEFAGLAAQGRLIGFDLSDPSPWWTIKRTRTSRHARPTSSDLRDDPDQLAEARATLTAEGWAKGYESLVRQAIARRSNPAGLPPRSPNEPKLTEALALLQGGSRPVQARELVDFLEARGVVSRTKPTARVEATTDALLADLLGSALADAANELRDAGSELVRYHHPARAEASIGERPPWPPASVIKLREAPNGEALVETLIDQVAPDPTARAWLKASWSQARRPIDGSLLIEIAAAANGRLANDPRFRAWLRGEWTAWNRQLYRRVARLAGGYVPS